LYRNYPYAGVAISDDPVPVSLRRRASRAPLSSTDPTIIHTGGGARRGSPARARSPTRTRCSP